MTTDFRRVELLTDEQIDDMNREFFQPRCCVSWSDINRLCAQAKIANRAAAPEASSVEEMDIPAMLRDRQPAPAQSDHRAAYLKVQAQAQDEGLWFDATTAPEAYLQAALRELHAAVEHDCRGAPAASELAGRLRELRQRLIWMRDNVSIDPVFYREFAADALEELDADLPSILRALDGGGAER